MKNPMTLAGIEPATFRFVAQHLNHCATAVPNFIQGVSKIFGQILRVSSSQHSKEHGRFNWPLGLRRGSAAAWLLGLGVRIPPGAWVCVSLMSAVHYQKSLWGAGPLSGEILPSVCDILTKRNSNPIHPQWVGRSQKHVQEKQREKKVLYSDTSANEDNSFRNHIR